MAADPTVVLLIGAETAIVDESGYARAVTPVGNAARTTAQAKFGAASIAFDGVGDRVEVADSADFSFGSGDFTIEGFFRFAAANTNQAMLGQWDDNSVSNNSSWLFFVPSFLTFRFGRSDTTGYIAITDSAWVPTLNQWYHLAVDRAGNTIRLYVDGVVKATNVTITMAMRDTSNKIVIGTIGTANVFPGQDFNGQMDEIRITKGLARYAGAFTPPTAAFPRPDLITGDMVTTGSRPSTVVLFPPMLPQTEAVTTESIPSSSATFPPRLPPAVTIEDFETYAVRTATSDAPLGPWNCYQLGIEAGTGHGGSKAALSYQGALSQGGVNFPSTNRWGNTVVWAYRFSVAELAARGRESLFYHGINIQPVSGAGGGGSQSGFGVMNDALGTQFGAGHQNDMVLFANWRAADGSTGTYRLWSSPCVVDSVWQKFDFRWKLSSIAPSSPYLSADGCIQLYVDNALVFDASGLYLTLEENTGPTVVNEWDGVYYAFAGLIDDLTISNEALACPDVIPELPAETFTRMPVGGYVNQPMRVVRHEMDPDTLKVQITLFDLGGLYASSFILGPDTIAGTWVGGTIFDHRYGYLSNDAGFYADGTPGKVLR